MSLGAKYSIFMLWFVTQILPVSFYIFYFPILSFYQLDHRVQNTHRSNIVAGTSNAEEFLYGNSIAYLDSHPFLQKEIQIVKSYKNEIVFVEWRELFVAMFRHF